MLEIILLIFLSRKIGDICANKGRSGTWFKVMLVAFWFLGEIVGAFTGAIVGGEGPLVYLFALIGAAAGAGITFLIVSSLKPTENAYMFSGDGSFNSLGLNNLNPSLPPQPHQNVQPNFQQPNYPQENYQPNFQQNDNIYK
jgi:hypothetical protein